MRARALALSASVPQGHALSMVALKTDNSPSESALWPSNVKIFRVVRRWEPGDITLSGAAARVLSFVYSVNLAGDAPPLVWPCIPFITAPTTSLETCS